MSLARPGHLPRPGESGPYGRSHNTTPPDTTVTTGTTGSPGLPRAGEAADGERDVDQPRPREPPPVRPHRGDRDAPRHQLPAGRAGRKSRRRQPRPTIRPLTKRTVLFALIAAALCVLAAGALAPRASAGAAVRAASAGAVASRPDRRAVRSRPPRQDPAEPGQLLCQAEHGRHRAVLRHQDGEHRRADRRRGAGQAPAAPTPLGRQPSTPRTASGSPPGCACARRCTTPAARST